MEEKIYTINIRKAISKAPEWEKSKKSVFFVKNFLKKHMKGDEVRIGKSITEKIWEKGSHKPPKKIRIHAILSEEGEGADKKRIIKAELLGIPFSVEKEKKKKEKKKEEKPKEEVKKEETKPEKPEEEKPEEKKEGKGGGN